MAFERTTPAVRAYILDSESIDWTRAWLEDLCKQAPEGYETEFVKSDPRSAGAEAAFAGIPFMLAGCAESIQQCFASCSEPALRVITDCAYFWTLSDTDRGIPPVSKMAKTVDHAIALSWNAKYFNNVLSPLELLNAHPDLAGLSISTHRTRQEIGRIANVEQGAFSPVLILGGPGSGKEKVARELWGAYRIWRKVSDGQVERRSTRATQPGINAASEPAQKSIACGWLSEHLLQDQMFGHEKGAFTGANTNQAGLLETLKDGCIFLDDFDVAPAITQGALLRVMSTDWGESASFSRLGSTSSVCTNAWLLFATNANIQKKLETGEIRPDFVYRFEDRVIHLRPLSERPADIPQIALKLWDAIWRGRKDPLRIGPAHIALLLSSKINWEGNVRQLRALLALSASRRRLTRKPLVTIFEEILARGDYSRWVGIILEPQSPTGEVASSTPAVPSCLSPAGADAFNEICDDLPSTRSGRAKTDNRVRLTRILEYASRRRSITPGQAQKLNRGSHATGSADLNILAGARNKSALLQSDGSTPPSYTPIPGMFR